MLACFIPVILFGIKYTEDLFKLKDHLLKTTPMAYYKRCARECALEVARNWNPGLTLSEQKNTLIRIADNVYNASPTYGDTPLQAAIPGIIIHDNGKTGTLDPSMKTIEYTDDINSEIYQHTINISSSMNLHVVLANVVNKMQRLSSRTDENIFSSSLVIYDSTSTNTTKYLFFTCDNLYKDKLLAALSSVNSSLKINSSTSISSVTYRERKNASDSTVFI